MTAADVVMRDGGLVWLLTVVVLVLLILALIRRL